MRRFRAISCVGALLLAVSAPAAEPAPALVVPTLAGPAFDLSAQRKHVVIVNFWATWCVPCRAEMPVLDDFYKKHKDKGLEMIGLSVDTPAALAKVKQTAASVSYQIAVARDAEKNGFPAPNALPITYVIDGKGLVKAVLMPEDDKGIDEAKLAKIVEPLLQSGP
jgi:cytochrome c biogenesis protein CcmG, thiol:disulfide interchange protein DsbE